MASNNNAKKQNKNWVSSKPPRCGSFQDEVCKSQGKKICLELNKLIEDRLSRAVRFVSFWDECSLAIIFISRTIFVWGDQLVDGLSLKHS
jgi:hypothetical protein